MIFSIAGFKSHVQSSYLTHDLRSIHSLSKPGCLRVVPTELKSRKVCGTLGVANFRG